MTMRALYASLACLLVAAACSGDDPGGAPLTPVVPETSSGTGGAGGAGTTSSGDGGGIVVGVGVGSGGSSSGSGGPNYEALPELWYSVEQSLIRITLAEDDGSVEDLVASEITTSLVSGQTSLTMLDDGSLLGCRLQKSDEQTYFFHIAEPPRDGSSVVATEVGIMPEGIQIEALYTDCDGRIYAMDTGENDSSAAGNRLLRFTGDVVGGDFSYVVVSDLASADVADIDDMAPGIGSDGQITDNPGLAIDTGTLYDFDYETGSGTEVASGGTWGIHALGGDLFADATARLFILSSDAELFEVDPDTFAVSEVLVTGPSTEEGPAGWAGLAGPLTDCETGFSPIPE